MDQYFENYREEQEGKMLSGGLNAWSTNEPVCEAGTVFLDDEIEKIEKQRGWPMNELYEGDLLEIVEEMKGIIADSAVWNGDMCAIEYTVKL